MKRHSKDDGTVRINLAISNKCSLQPQPGCKHCGSETLVEATTLGNRKLFTIWTQHDE
jgi:hypothetical protein